MKVILRKNIVHALFLILVNLPVIVNAQLTPNKLKDDTPQIASHFSLVNAESKWHLIASIPLHFTTYHTQGLTKVGDYYYLSAVRVNRWPKKYTTAQSGFDRDQGDGVGYLFKFDGEGKLIDSVRLGKDEVYHPGGIDFDGKDIWVPVCEYRPFGKSIIYRVDPQTLYAQVITTIPDAIGALAYNRTNNELTGMNWGSRIFYRWKINKTENTAKAILQGKNGQINPHFYIDFQDCSYVGNDKMLCSGLRSYTNANGESVKLGGLELIDMKTYDAGLQLPVSMYTGKGIILTNNPFFIDIVHNSLQYYFVPEDDQSVLYIYRLQ